MEPEILKSGILYLQNAGIHCSQIAIDGDAKIPKLTRELNGTNEMVQQLGGIQLRTDKAHAKKNLPKTLYSLKS